MPQLRQGEDGSVDKALRGDLFLRSLPLLPSVLLSSAALLPAFIVAPAMAQEDPAGTPVVDEDDDEDNEVARAGEILVVATRIRGQVDAPQPPILVLDEADVQSYGASTLDELLEVLAPQTGSGRGRGSGGPVILVNGQRIANFREFRNIPPEAIRRMEVLPEEVALRFGYPADQRVVNFILKDDFSNRSVDLEYNAPSSGGYAQSEIEGSLLKINKANRLNLNVKAEDSSMLTEAERGIVQENGENLRPGDRDPADFRSLVSDSRDLTGTASWSTGLGSAANSGSLSLNGQIARSDSRSLSGLNSVLVTGGAGEVLRTYGDPLGRDSRTVTASGGATLNKGFDGWNLTATLDASHAETETRVDRRTAVADGAITADGPLPTFADPGRDLALTRNRTLNSLVTLAGSPARLPAGEVSVTVKGGFSYTGIRSSDTRTILAGVTTLNRGDLSTGVNIGVPIASRRENVLSGIGDLSLNFSAGLNRLSDFGTLVDWSAGLNWTPFEKLGFQASYMVNEEAPSLAALGNPQIENFNVPVYDFSRGETVLITTSSGGNPDLKKETQRDLKIGANWTLPFLKNSNLVVEYFRNRSDDVTQSFPLLTPEIEAAFPGRAVRDPVTGQLVSIDRRSVTFAQTNASRLRYGFNISGTIGKPDPTRQRGPGMGMGLGMGPGGPGGPRGPGGGGPRMGGPRGPGGGGPGMMGGAGNGQGRWNLSLYHTIRFEESVLIAAGGPELDLLDGQALTDGGVARNAFEFEGGAFHKGFGLRFNGSWTAPTTLRGSALPGATDLRFGALFKLDLRAFINFDQQKSVVEAVPFLKGSRLSFDVKNVFNSIQRVTDDTGEVPLSYQRGYLDPQGRFLGIDFRKTF